MRRRDIHAIAFAGVTMTLLVVSTAYLSRSYLVAGSATAAYAVALFTRPRMIRMMRRVFGGRRDAEWRGYYDD